MIFDIHNSDLGKSTEYQLNYDASLLFRIPRAENREKYAIDSAASPFVGYDVWNCYELSFLTSNGLPVVCLLKMVVSSHSEYIVESKSLKLYLFSLNMKRFESTINASLQKAQQLIKADLEALLETEVQISLLHDSDKEKSIFVSHDQLQLSSLIDDQVLATIEFDHFKEAPDLLIGSKCERSQLLQFKCDLLRSNCRVTNQPDWGELFVTIESNFKIDLVQMLAYIVSFREENHFHEEVVEMIYKRLWDTFSPSKLMVAATYTRRGGIDINPIRASESSLMDAALINPSTRIKKSFRQ